jgi:hypothetical protein
MEIRERRGREVSGKETHRPLRPTYLYYSPREEEHVQEQGHVPAIEEITMMHYFQTISDAIMNRLEREEGGVSMHMEGSQNPLEYPCL